MMKTTASYAHRALRAMRGFVFAGGACAALAVTALTNVGCGDDPVQAPAGFEARGTVLRAGSADLVVDSSGVTGSISVVEGGATEEISALFLAKADGKRTTPTGADFKLGWAVADESVATIEQVSAWTIKVRGKKAGTTTATIKVQRGTTTDYTSAAITINVSPAVRGLALGDTATFLFTDRDSLNQPISSSQKRKVWVVVEAGLSLYGKTGVSRIIETTYDMAGGVLETDTLYQQTDTDGSVYVYDYLRMLLGRVVDGAAFDSALPALWVKISNVNLTGGATWNSLPVDSQVVKNVTTSGLPTALDITFRLAGTHRGTQSSTVPAGTFAAAVRTDHALKLVVKPSSLPITALNDSLIIHCDADAGSGILRQTLDSKTLVAKVLTVTQALPVAGFEMALESLKRKR